MFLELITNSAAAAIMLTTGLAAGTQLGLPPVAIAVTVAIGASASFVTPIGYQTNLMVMAAGRYRFADFARVGFPTALISMTVAVTSIYLVWVR
jgi:di/tricarboxylate transporter